MKRLLNRMPRLSRTGRIARNTICAALVVFIAWLWWGAPAFGKEGQFRRAEKEHLVGPSELLGTVAMTEGVCLVGETEAGVILYVPGSAPESTRSSGLFVYTPKSGDITLAGEAAGSLDPFEVYTTTLVAVTDLPGAVRAELELDMRYNWETDADGADVYLDEYRAVSTAERHENGFFALELTGNGEVIRYLLSMLPGHERWNMGQLRYTIRLFGADGEPVGELSYAFDSREEQKEWEIAAREREAG